MDGIVELVVDLGYEDEVKVEDKGEEYDKVVDVLGDEVVVFEVDEVLVVMVVLFSGNSTNFTVFVSIRSGL